MLPIEAVFPIVQATIVSCISYSALEFAIRSIWPLPPTVHDSRWQAVLYSSNVVVGSIVAYHTKEWFFDGYQYHDQEPIEPAMQIYMGVGIGTYIHLIFYQLFVAPVMKDQYVMLAHHILTLVLLGSAIGTGLYRWAGPIMLVHDLADPPLHIAKMINRQAQLSDDKTARQMFQKLADFFFMLFIATFYVTRLYLYPSKIIWINYMTRDKTPYSVNAMTFFMCLLIMLLVMHVYWGFLLAQVIYRKVVKGELGDNREDEDDEAHSNDKSTTTKGVTVDKKNM